MLNTYLMDKRVVEVQWIGLYSTEVSRDLSLKVELCCDSTPEGKYTAGDHQVLVYKKSQPFGDYTQDRWPHSQPPLCPPKSTWWAGSCPRHGAGHWEHAWLQPRHRPQGAHGPLWRQQTLKRETPNTGFSPLSRAGIIDLSKVQRLWFPEK